MKLVEYRTKEWISNILLYVCVLFIKPWMKFRIGLKPLRRKARVTVTDRPQLKHNKAVGTHTQEHIRKWIFMAYFQWNDIVRCCTWGMHNLHKIMLHKVNIFKYTINLHIWHVPYSAFSRGRFAAPNVLLQYALRNLCFRAALCATLKWYLWTLFCCVLYLFSCLVWLMNFYVYCAALHYNGKLLFRPKAFREKLVVFKIRYSCGTPSFVFEGQEMMVSGSQLRWFIRILFVHQVHIINPPTSPTTSTFLPIIFNKLNFSSTLSLNIKY